MKEKIMNIISIILPLITVFVIAFAIRTQPTGFAVYENKTLYRIEGSVSITLQERIPLDSYVSIKVDDYTTKMHLLEFIKMCGKDYKVIEEEGKRYIIGNNTYSVDFTSLGIIQGFEKGRHIIKTEIVYENSVLNSNEELFEV